MTNTSLQSCDITRLLMPISGRTSSNRQRNLQRLSKQFLFCFFTICFLTMYSCRRSDMVTDTVLWKQLENYFVGNSQLRHMHGIKPITGCKTPCLDTLTINSQSLHWKQSWRFVTKAKSLVSFYRLLLGLFLTASLLGNSIELVKIPVSMNESCGKSSFQMEHEFALFLGLGSTKSLSSAAQWLKEQIVWESLRMPSRNTLLERL